MEILLQHFNHEYSRVSYFHREHRYICLLTRIYTLKDRGKRVVLGCMVQANVKDKLTFTVIYLITLGAGLIIVY